MSLNLFLRTPAKVNPVLEVLGRRPDGFHELALVFQAVALYDELRMEEGGSGLRLEVEGSTLPADDSNLVLRAARLFAKEALGKEPGVRIGLTKRIPMAAGLGGGSSDAAATLLGLDRLFKTGWGPAKLQPLAAQLGSDVAFFLKGGTALGTGRGEIIEPWDSPASWSLVLVKPAEGLSTPSVYGSGKALFTGGEKARAFRQVAADGRADRIGRALFNGLEPAALFLLPLIGKVREALEKAGSLGVLVSGSGPTVFGVAENADHAERIRGSLEGRGWEVWAVQAVPDGVQFI
ncbi:MAG TPA: 4-(cytidine 5'-diphospho)-2-C-methyl-D-erythritol kinase [bacterium]|nr:4-(cytidine 5'-diphospho)-2-C-methyl-D-erythritol kinase [bacterium]